VKFGREEKWSRRHLVASKNGRDHIWSRGKLVATFGREEFWTDMKNKIQTNSILLQKFKQ